MQATTKRPRSHLQVHASHTGFSYLANDATSDTMDVCFVRALHVEALVVQVNVLQLQLSLRQLAQLLARLLCGFLGGGFFCFLRCDDLGVFVVLSATTTTSTTTHDTSTSSGARGGVSLRHHTVAHVLRAGFLPLRTQRCQLAQLSDVLRFLGFLGLRHAPESTLAV